jgi:lysophospholipase L1-like esterase
MIPEARAVQAADVAGSRRPSRRAAIGILGAALTMLAGGIRAADLLSPSVIERSRVGLGDLKRLRAAFAKARRGEAVTIGVVGGSITVGAMATTPDRSYAARVLAWWRARFPASDVRLVNAGVGGTGCLYGAFRVGKDLLASKPDFVIVEFAVNDAWTDGEPFEGLIRQILARPNAPAVLLLFMMWQGGGNDQAMQAKVGAHYALPMVSFRDAFWPEMSAGRLQWSDLLVDVAHPNDAGHAAAARLVTSLLETADGDSEANGRGATDPLPAPLYSDQFQFTRWRVASVLQPLGNDGWLRLPGNDGAPAWIDGRAGQAIAFDWTGTGLVALLGRPRGAGWRVDFRIDNDVTRSIDDSTQPNRDILIVAEALAEGRHTVRIERVDGETGRALELAALGEIGLR